MFSMYSNTIIQFSLRLLFARVRDVHAYHMKKLPLMIRSDFQAKPKHLPTGSYQTFNDSEMKI